MHWGTWHRRHILVLIRSTHFLSESHIAPIDPATPSGLEAWKASR